MKRLIDHHLKKWKDDPKRRPLLVRGARRVGKTFAVRNLAKGFDHFLEVNFKASPEAKKIFETGTTTEKILQDLSHLTGKRVEPGKTLLFLDEAQECPAAVLTLRDFYESLPSLHLVVSGSFLDFTLEGMTLLAGHISNLFIFPVSFMEFLAATGQEKMFKAILSHDQSKPMPEDTHLKLLEQVGHYMAVGGMPEAVEKWAGPKSSNEISKLHQNFLKMVMNDFPSYAKEDQIPCIEEILKNIPHTLGKPFDSKGFEDFTKSQASTGIDLLFKANVVRKVYFTTGDTLPLGAHIDKDLFKVTFMDVGLWHALSKGDLSKWTSDPLKEMEKKEDLVDAFIGQEILCYSQPNKKNELHFWKDPEGDKTVDYVFEYREEAVPIDTKHGDKKKSKGMDLFLKTHPASPQGVKFSMLNYVNSRPLYDVVSFAHEEQKESLRSLL